MTDPLHQINVSYVPREDRLLMRITTREGDEYRIWITRRYAALLLDVLRKQMDQYGGAPSLASSDETRQMFRQGVMEKKFEPERSERYPLGESGILAVRINAGRSEGGDLCLQLSPDGSDQGVTLNLNRTFTYLFYNVLTQGIDQAEWHLDAGTSGNVH